jgi:two-component system response regulator AtoC
MYRRPDITPTRFHGMLTVSDEMREFFELVRRVARTEAPALIRGQTGTGKELVAHAIHRLSGRTNGPFQVLNCATLTPDLLASRLFGHVKGAFTGAVRDREGLFKRADKGTIFLDEIAEVPLDLQAKLLRVLEEKTFTPVGQTEPVEVDVRLVSATHVSLREAVNRGTFREDLMYRIRVVPLFLPPLADRDGDIELLTWHFIDEFSDEAERDIVGVSDAAMEAMLSYDWPGNVRELRNVVRRALIIGSESTIQLKDLTPELRGEAVSADLATESATESAAEPVTEQSLERRRLVDALDQAGGKKQEAADRLGISRTTLWRKLKEHGISDTH